MVKIELTKQITINNNKVKELNIDFEAVNGNMMLDAEKMARTKGDTTPQVMFSQVYALALASKVCPLSFKELSELPGKDTQKIFMAVNDFLFV